jgi:hypothetical protein
MGRRRRAGVLFVLAGCALPLAAATPPTRIGYQGVLRNPAGTPLVGNFDMTFRLWSAQSGGDEIFLDRHLAANGQAVPVTGGLFTVEIGAGLVHDGAGPGTFLTLPTCSARSGTSGSRCRWAPRCWPPGPASPQRPMR